MTASCPTPTEAMSVAKSAGDPGDSARSPRAELLAALLRAEELQTVVPAVLDIVEAEPLASAGCFAGDLLRGLMELGGDFWGRHAALYARYREAVRRAAVLRRDLPPGARFGFWSPIPPER